MAVERVVGTVLLRMAGVLLLAVALTAVLAPRQPNITYSRGRVLVCLVLAGGLVALASWALHRYDGAVPRLAGPLVAALGSAGCTALAFALRYDFGWDARVVAGMSHRLAAGQDLSAYQYGYLSRYPNNLPLLVVDNLCEGVGAVTHLAPATVFVLLNGLALAVALASTYWLVSMLRGPAYGVVAELVVLGLVGLSPWMSVSYTDLVAMPFVVLATALVVALPRTGSRPRQATYAVLAVACLLLGYTVKTTPVVSLVAIGLVAALVWVSRRTGPRRVIAVGVVAGVALFLGGSLVAKQVTPAVAGISADRIDRSRTPPTVWWVYMASTQHAVDGRMRYGGYDTDIVRATRGLDAGASGRWARAHFSEHLSDLGPGGYLAFLANKAAWNWGDGMFWAWGEGVDRTEPALVHGTVADFVAVWNHPDGAGYAWRAAMAQAGWLLLLLVAGARLLRARWTWEIGLLTLSVLGIAAFTLVFQGRSRYLLVYVPVIVALAVSLPPALVSRRSRLGRHDDHR